MQKLKRLDDMLERDAERIDEERRTDRPSAFQMQIDDTTDEIRHAFRDQHATRPRIKAKLTDNA